MSVYSGGHTAVSIIDKMHLRRVWLVSTTAESEVRPVLRQLPSADTSLQDLVPGWGCINHVAQPSAPTYTIN